MILRGLQRLVAAFAVLAMLALGWSAPAQAQLSDLSKEGTITALNGAVALDTGGRQTLSVLLSGTWTATVVAEVSTDGGTTWESTDLYDVSGRARAANTTGNGTFILIGTGGMNRVRVKASAYTTGTVTALLRASNGRPTIEVADVTNAAPGSTAFGTVVRTLTGTGSSADQVQGTAADGAAAVGNPVQIGGKDGSGNIQSVLTDTGGAVQADIESIAAGDNNIGNVDIVTGPTGATALQTQGTVADGSAAAQNPVRIGGKDGAGNVQDILTDTAGAIQTDIESGPTGTSALQSQGTAADGAAAVGNPLQIAGKDGSGNAQAILTDTGGAVQADIESGPTGASALQLQGTQASGSALVGNPLVVAGSAGANAIVLKTDSGGAVQADIESGPTGTSALQSQGTAADGAAAVGSPLQIGGKDGAGNIQAVLTDTGGAIQADIESIAAGDNNIGNVDVVTMPTGASASQVQGTVADGSAVAQNPVRIGGKDGSGNVQDILTDTGGAMQVDVESIAAGTNYIGKVRKTDGTNDVNAFVDADSGAGTEYREGVVLRKMASGGSVEAGTAADPIRVDPTGTTTQPVSGTVTANQGTAAAAANSWRTRLSDGTNDAASLTDTDTGGGTDYRQGIVLRKSASGGSVELGTSSDPIRTDPTGTTIQPVSGTVTANAGTGTFTVGGTAADGAAASGNPVQIGGKDGAGNAQALLTDTGGAVQADIESISAGDNNIGNVDIVTGPTGATALQSQGTVADGLAAAQNPVRVAGKDGSGNVQDILTDTTGAIQSDIESGPTGTSALQFQGTQASGSALVGNPVVIAGSAGANAIVMKTDAGGAVQTDVESGPTGTSALQSQGTAADGVTAVGNPLQMGGKDGSGNAQALLTDTGGAVQADIESIAAGDNNIGNVDIVTGPTGASAFEVQGTVADGGVAAQKPVQTAGVDGSGNIQAIKTDTTGSVQVDIESGPTAGNALQMQGPTADGSPHTTSPVMIGGSDGANVQTISVDSLGEVQVDVKSMPTSGNATQVQGTVADGLTATGNPVQIAGADGSGNAQRVLTDTGGAIQVDIEAGSSVSITGTATVDSELAAAGALADGATNPTTSTIGALAHVFNGTTWDRLRDNAAAPTTQYRAAVATGIGTITLLNAVSSTGAGSASNLGTAAQTFGLQVSATGAPTSVVVHLEGTNDAGSNWFKLGVWTLAAQTLGDIVEVRGPPVQRIRANLTTLSGGAAPTVTANVTGI